MRIVLDGAAIRSESDLHDALQGLLELGPHYGRNLNALWDVLSTDAPRPLTIRWTNARLSRAALGAHFERIVELLAQVSEADGGLPSGARFALILEE
ncbi:MAG: barstar family protein [Nannocystaceae bacterium]